ncbi:hypothetical protein [Priestia koreensis]|uniref:hypothetical protein n=1 Tax=Priestia koreensis TaxID=284581 RepID=UPI00345A9A2C
MYVLTRLVLFFIGILLKVIGAILFILELSLLHANEHYRMLLTTPLVLFLSGFLLTMASFYMPFALSLRKRKNSPNYLKNK